MSQMRSRIESALGGDDSGKVVSIRLTFGFQRRSSKPDSYATIESVSINNSLPSSRIECESRNAGSCNGYNKGAGKWAAREKAAGEKVVIEKVVIEKVVSVTGG
jgi:hypothetical protein